MDFPKSEDIMKHTLMKRCLCIFLFCLFLTACGKKDNVTDPAQMETENQQSAETQAADSAFALLMPWEADGAKQPEEYTMAEYEGLTAEQRKAFFNYLGADRYAAWLKRAEAEAENEVDIPWKNPLTKQPREYTWEEYQALTEAQKIAFMEALGPHGLEAWLSEIKGGSGSQNGNNGQDDSFAYGGGNHQNNTQYPWEKTDAKKPKDYTWEEYDALSLAQQKAFRSYLGEEGFLNWLKKAEEAEYPWKAEGAKQPADYSWEEYESLKDSQKKEFQETLGASGFQKWQENALSDMPWKAEGAKQPKDYSWTDYKNLTDAQKGAFQEYLGKEAMMAWLRTIAPLPWEAPNAKQPEEYTLKEYEALKESQQLAFQLYMGIAEFEAWMIEAKNPVQTYPWDKAGAKQPADYTLEEFNALTADQQMAFQKHLGTAGFENWLNKVQEKPAANPWDVPGAKQPADYTWAEFNALTEAQQMAFQNKLGDKGFETWLNKVQKEPTADPAANPWDAPGAKQPTDYTMAEFNALTEAQQMAFQNKLGPTAFEAWLNKAQEEPAVDPETNPWDVPGAKQPADYTMAEFNALTAAQQMAFQNKLGPTAFEAWLNKVQEEPSVDPETNPWDVPGAKQPADYTMAEFNALTAAQQMAFQNKLGPTAFEAWLNKALEQPAVEPTEEPTVDPTVESTVESTGESTVDLDDETDPSMDAQ